MENAIHQQLLQLRYIEKMQNLKIQVDKEPDFDVNVQSGEKKLKGTLQSGATKQMSESTNTGGSNTTGSNQSHGGGGNHKPNG